MAPGTGFVRDNRGFLGGSIGKEPACQWRRHKETWVQSLGQEDPLGEGMAPHSSTLAWKIPWMRSLVVYSPWGSKELDTTE